MTGIGPGADCLLLATHRRLAVIHSDTDLHTARNSAAGPSANEAHVSVRNDAPAILSFGPMGEVRPASNSLGVPCIATPLPQLSSSKLTTDHTDFNLVR